MPSGEVDPNTCGNYAASDAGAKLKVFLQSIKDLQTATDDAAKVVKNSCVTMGQELNMSADDLGGDDTGKICNAVIKTYQDNLKVTLKAGAKLTVKFVPGKCTVNASASASAAAAARVRRRPAPAAPVRRVSARRPRRSRRRSTRSARPRSSRSRPTRRSSSTRPSST